MNPIPTIAATIGETQTLRRHIAETLRLAIPLAGAQLAQMAMAVTDTVLLGSLGGDALAAGGLGANLYFTTTILFQGVLTSVGVLVAHARGAGHPERIPGIYRTGQLLAVALAVLAFALLSCAAPILRALGEPPALSDAVGRYEDVLRWGVPASLMGLGVMRSFLPAINHPRIIFYVTLSAVGINGLLNYGLIHGAWGLPALGYLGSATATAITVWGTGVALTAAPYVNPRLRGFVRGSRVSGAVLREMLRLGWPTAITFGVELGVFLATGLVMGLLGTAALAAHQMALNIAATTFMVPLAISQAANVRVGLWMGARRLPEARRAGFVAIGIAASFMTVTAIALITLPRTIVGLYLDVLDPRNAETVRLAVVLLGLAGIFQIVDGIQVVASGCLRSLKDTRIPMLIATFGYWGIGFAAGYVLAFRLGVGAPGLWIGLAIGLATVSTLLTLRFHRRTRPGGTA
ncbi:MAG: family efflux transporter [Rhodospirillales bacterium]|nr:family efflux transporter [Rhodospirillales bacterium]